jgi:hypothetical protein
MWKFGTASGLKKIMRPGKHEKNSFAGGLGFCNEKYWFDTSSVVVIWPTTV